jgi:hypothetical protein
MRRHRRWIGRALIGSAVMLALAVGAGVGAPSAAAASVSGAEILAIYFDSPGADRGGNASLDAEWVKLRNVTHSRKTLTHWTLRDSAHHVYRLPSFTLGAGATVRIHTGSGRRTSSNLYWGQHWYVWNNTGDKAILRNASGKTVDTCSYTKSADPEKHC